MTSQGAVPVGVLVLFECVELAALPSLVCQQLSQHNLHPVFKESDILHPIAFQPHVKDVHLPVLDCLTPARYCLFQHLYVVSSYDVVIRYLSIEIS